MEAPQSLAQAESSHPHSQWAFTEKHSVTLISLVSVLYSPSLWLNVFISGTWPSFQSPYFTDSCGVDLCHSSRLREEGLARLLPFTRPLLGGWLYHCAAVHGLWQHETKNISRLVFRPASLKRLHSDILAFSDPWYLVTTLSHLESTPLCYQSNLKPGMSPSVADF